MFGRPNKNECTNHLFIVGKDVSHIVNQYLDINTSIRAVATIHYHPDKVNILYLTLPSIDEATDTMNDMKGNHMFTGLSIQYAAYNEKDEVIRSSLIPVMSSAFVSLPPGVTIIRDFITSKDEEEIMFNLNKSDWIGGLKRRRVQHYGAVFDYSIRRAKLDEEGKMKPLPSFLIEIIKKGIEYKVFDEETIPNQVTVNEYEPGNGIPPHVDTHSAFENNISSLSMCSDTVMSFTREWKGERMDIYLPRLSMLIMKDEGRYDWEHSIADRKTDIIDGNTKRRQKRVSITFRCIRSDSLPCPCEYTQMCDSKAMLHPHLYTIRQLQKIGAIPNDKNI